MERWKQLEFEYAQKLRASTRPQRIALHREAYSAAAKARMETLDSADPEKRAARASPALMRALLRSLRARDRVLEVGCGRECTMLKLAPHVKELVGTAVSQPSLAEACNLLESAGLTNVRVVEARADDLASHFDKESFDEVVSIDVYEHLHPQDAAIHLSQVFDVLRPGGEYLLCTPNRYTSPHDITRHEFPQQESARGFHLSETTFSELLPKTKALGFGRFRAFLWVTRLRTLARIVSAVAIPLCIERFLGRSGRLSCNSRVLAKLLHIGLIARKRPPGHGHRCAEPSQCEPLRQTDLDRT
jgi:2-polyprenyl-3-methyl-5-hydroxy-6-metoxy-1,4-benzoquinol methylase